MKIDNLIWYSAEKEDLPEVALGSGDFRGRESLFSPSMEVSGARIRVAFARDDASPYGYRPPSLFMLRQKDAAETLSWLRVYAKEAFPLSQAARVITDQDWNIFFSQASDGVTARTDMWACLVLGEILAQGETDIEVDSVPISRASACFTTAIARAHYIYDSSVVTRTCAERLRFVADDPRFVRRPVSVDALVPAWALASANLGDTDDLRELAELVLHASETIERSAPSISFARALLKENDQIFSDSVEERVVAFQRLASETAANMARIGKSSSAAAALLAIGAFLVGRGTSHAFLLRKFSGVAPASFVWFGLIAALRGAHGWDPVWLRLTKGVEKQLRASFEMGDPPVADICWTEFIWLSQTFSGSQGVSDLARLLPRTLSVEVVPGAACQFRLAAGNRSHTDLDRQSAHSSHEAETRSLLEQILALSTKARALLETIGAAPSTQQQQPLIGLDSDNSNSKGRTKRTYKRSGK